MKMSNVYGIIIYLLYHVKYLASQRHSENFTDLTQKLPTALKILHTSYAVICVAITNITSPLHISFHIWLNIIIYNHYYLKHDLMSVSWSEIFASPEDLNYFQNNAKNLGKGYLK